MSQIKQRAMLAVRPVPGTGLGLKLAFDSGLSIWEKSLPFIFKFNEFATKAEEGEQLSCVCLGVPRLTTDPNGGGCSSWHP